MVATKRSKMAAPASTPIDHGYAWIILASCTLLRLLVDGFWSSLGILMLQWEKYFDVSSSKTGWIGSSFMFILLSSAPVASALSNRLTYRFVVVGAGILIFVCIFSLSLVTQFWQVYFIMPVLGFGFGVVYQTSVIYFVYYFQKRYALANGIATCAGGIGYLIFPSLLEILNTYFGSKGALQLTAAIMANVCVLGALLRPSKIEKTRRKSTSNSPEKIKPPQPKAAEHNTDTKTNNCCYGLIREVADNFDLTLFRRRTFIFQSVLNGFLYGGIYCTTVYFVPYAVSTGIPEIKSSFLMSAQGASQFIIRLSPLVGYLVDKDIVSDTVLTGTSFVINGIATLILPFVTNYGGLMAIAVIFGTTVGTSGAVIMVIIVKAAGSRDKAPGAASFLLLLCGVGSLVGILCTGFLFDATGSFQPPLTICGVFTIVMGINCLLYPLQERWQERIDSRRKLELDNNNKQYIYTSLVDVSKSNQV